MALGGDLGGSSSDAPGASRMLRIEYQGQPYDWFNLDEMKDVVRTPDFASTLRENIAHYFSVPLEFQTMYDEEGPVASTLDVNRTLQSLSPCLKVYDVREMQADFRERTAKLLEEAAAEVAKALQVINAMEPQKPASEPVVASGGSCTAARGPVSPTQANSGANNRLTAVQLRTSASTSDLPARQQSTARPVYVEPVVPASPTAATVRVSAPLPGASYHLAAVPGPGTPTRAATPPRSRSQSRTYVQAYTPPSGYASHVAMPVTYREGQAQRSTTPSAALRACSGRRSATPPPGGQGSYAAPAMRPTVLPGAPSACAFGGQLPPVGGSAAPQRVLPDPASWAKPGAAGPRDFYGVPGADSRSRQGTPPRTAGCNRYLDPVAAEPVAAEPVSGGSFGLAACRSRDALRPLAEERRSEAPAQTTQGQSCLAPNPSSHEFPARGGREAGEVEVVLQKSTRQTDAPQRFGFANVPAGDGRGLFVSWVDDTGLLARWNRQFPDKAVCKEDRIVSVNGIHSDVEGMRSQLQQDAVRMVVHRRSASTC